jgi:hypothetical protein
MVILMKLISSLIDPLSIPDRCFSSDVGLATLRLLSLLLRHIIKDVLIN